MRKIIDGKIYDTKTALEIAEKGLYTGRFQDFEETLYRTKKGSWFLSGHGGPMSHYAESNGNGYSSGEGIRPLSDQDAYEWLERYQETDLIEEYFSDRIEEA